MKARILALVTMVFLIFASFMNLNAQWAKTYGGSEDDIAYCVQQTSDGGYVVAGVTESFGAGEEDIWVLKLSNVGAIEWQKAYGGSNREWFPPSIQQTADEGYILAGATDSFGAGERDIWMLKLSSTGDIEWQRTYGYADYDDAHSIQQTSDGGYVVAGSTWGAFGDSRDIWILKLSSIGIIEWQRLYGGALHQRANSIRQTVDGGYIVGGSAGTLNESGIYVLKLSSEGDIEWQKIYEGIEASASSIRQTSDGGHIVAGHIRTFKPNGDYNIWILKLSSTGFVEWQRAYGGSDWDIVNSFQQTDDRGYIVAGYTMSSGFEIMDTWIFKLDSVGDIEWEKIYIGHEANSIQQTNDGGYVVAVDHWTDIGGCDFFILKLASNGDIDSSCGFIEDSAALIIDTDTISIDAYLTPKVTKIIPLDTFVSPQDTDAITNLLCGRGHTLMISAATGGTTDPAPGDYAYDEGTEVTITATPDSGYEFSEWSGDATGTGNPITVTMDSDKSVTANFSVVRPEEPEEPGKKGGCFIATAAYGTPLHPHLNILREFRDKHFMTNKFGRGLVKIYYRYSPLMARLIARNEALKITVRIALLPLVGLSFLTVH